jgi:adenylosuccinate lyase
MIDLLENLVVFEDKVTENLEKAGNVVFSGHYLLALVKAGVTREQSYTWVQSCALQSYDKKEDFIDLLAHHPEIKKTLGEKKIREMGTMKYQLRHVGEIYKRSKE